jgi:predicted nucleic acid-binding protein
LPLPPSRSAAIGVRARHPSATRSASDLRIASIALSRGLVVVTGNVRHFSRVPDLRVENWLTG